MPLDEGKQIMTLAPTTSFASPHPRVSESDDKVVRRALSSSSPEFERRMEESRRRTQAMSPLRFLLKQQLWRLLGVLTGMVARL
jgi:hypothetical protein